MTPIMEVGVQEKELVRDSCVVDGGKAPHPGHKTSFNTALWEAESKPGVAGYILRNLIKQQNDLKPFCYAKPGGKQSHLSPRV